MWFVGYGAVQATDPRWVETPDGRSATRLAFLPAAIAAALATRIDPAVVVVAGLLVFGVVFALNSAVHSYRILAYADGDKVTMNVGYYYMANAGGRLAGTILSGLLYEWQGLQACPLGVRGAGAGGGRAVAVAAGGAAAAPGPRERPRQDVEQRACGTSSKGRAPASGSRSSRGSPTPTAGPPGHDARPGGGTTAWLEPPGPEPPGVPPRHRSRTADPARPRRPARAGAPRQP